MTLHDGIIVLMVMYDICHSFTFSYLFSRLKKIRTLNQHNNDNKKNILKLQINLQLYIIYIYIYS